MDKENSKNFENIITGEAILTIIRKHNERFANLLEEIRRKIYHSIENYQTFKQLWQGLDKTTQKEIRNKSLAFHYLAASSVPYNFAQNYQDEPVEMIKFIEKLCEKFKIKLEN